MLDCYSPAVPEAAEEAFDRSVAEGIPFSWRRGCRGHPDVPSAFGMLVRSARDARGDWVDASGCLGLSARAATQADARVIEASATARSAIEHDLSGGGEPLPERSGSFSLEAGLPWDLPARSADRIALAPPADRGSTRVIAEIAAAASALRDDGELILVLDKRLGARRYEREAAARFAGGGVAERDGGVRRSRWFEPRRDADAVDPWLTFEAEGMQAVALAGVHAAGKMDPGTRVLLDVLGHERAIPPSSSVLDVGCGWGPIARFAVRSGARVVALDDDLAAVRSCRRNVPDADVRHLDATRPWRAPGSFDRVLVNPPFHVGRSVRTDLGRALLREARRHLAPHGELWWVENRALRYDRDAELADADERRDEAGFRVMRVEGRTRR